MLDPFPPPPLWLSELVQPWAERFGLHSLPDHIHEVLFIFVFYLFIHSYLSPRLSVVLFPRSYPHLPRRTQINWDVHVVSFIQSTLISLLAIWVMIVDRERKEMTTAERIYGYTGACGLVQALATGYFLYDLIVSTVYIDLFGIGMLFHAVSALLVYGLGFVSILFFMLLTVTLRETPCLSFFRIHAKALHIHAGISLTCCPFSSTRSPIFMVPLSFFTSSPALSSTSTGFWIKST
jgi:TLC domain